MNRHYFIITLLFLMTISIWGCRSAEPVAEQAPEPAQPAPPLAVMLDTSSVFSSNLTGFALYDPEVDSLIYGQYVDKYFTPASNTKLFTFYTGLKLLPERLRALEYVVRGDSLIFWGSGDPSFLHPDLASGEVYRFLKDRPEDLYYADSHYLDELQGPGWAWGDYNYYYSPEKTPLPIYGNVVRFKVQRVERRELVDGGKGTGIFPDYFQRHIKRVDHRREEEPLLFRELAGNTFKYKPQGDTVTYTVDKPFHYTPELVTGLLSDTLNKPVKYVEMVKPDSTQYLYSISSDTAFKHMLQPSDNLIAEQLLLVASSELDLPMNSRNVINYMKKEYLQDLVDEPQWVDGSGLSRYNMFTPRSIIQLLEKIDSEFSNDNRLFELLPAGGERGTIRNWYGPRDGGAPYVFAKTGTLSNNHSLSGYLITSSGRKLLFSIMNNHYVTPTSVVKKEMEKLLWHIYRQY